MKHILIATERDLEYNLLSQALASDDVTLLRCRDGLEVLDVLRSSQPSLLLVNVALPRMDGFALYRRCEQDEQLSSLPFVLFSTRSKDEKSARFAEELGVSHFVPDALRSAALRQTVEEVLSPSQTAELPVLRTGTGSLVSVLPSAANHEPAASDAHHLVEQMEQQARTLQSLRSEATRQTAALEEVQRQLARKIEEASELGGLFKGSPVAMWLVDKQSQRIVAANEAMSRLFGYASAELESMHSNSLLQESQATAATQVLAFRHKDGRVLSLLLSVGEVMFRGAPAELTAAQDVSYRVRGERALADEVLRLKSLLAALPAAYCVCDGAGVVREANEAACSLLNTSRERLLGQPLAETLGIEGATLQRLAAGESHVHPIGEAPGSLLRVVRGQSVSTTDQMLFLLQAETLPEPAPQPDPQPEPVVASPPARVLPAMMEVMRFSADADEATLLQYAVARIAYAFDSPVAVLVSAESIARTMEVLALTPHGPARRNGHNGYARIAIPEQWHALLDMRSTGLRAMTGQDLMIEGWPELDSYQVCAIADTAREQWLLLTANREAAYGLEDQEDLLHCADMLAMVLHHKRQLQLATVTQQRQSNLANDALALLQRTLDQQQNHAAVMAQVRQSAVPLFQQQNNKPD